MDSQPVKSPGLIARLFDAAAQFAAAVIVAAAIFLAGKYYLFDEIDDQIRNKVEATLRDRYPGLQVSVTTARRLEGQGIEVRGISIREGGNHHAPVILNLEHLFVGCETKLPDMVTQPLVIHHAEIRGVRLRAERKASGVWNVQHLLPMPTHTGTPFPITIRDVAFEIVDPLRSPQAGMTLRDVQLSLIPQQSPSTGPVTYTLQGTGSGDHFEKLEFEGNFVRGFGEWSISGAVEGLEFTPRLRGALPTECDRWLEPLASIRGRTQFGFRVTQPAAESPQHANPPLDFRIVGDVSEGRIDDNRLPEPLTDVSAHVEADVQGLRIERLQAHCGTSTVQAELATGGFTLQSPVETSITLNGWSLERIPPGLLPAHALEELRKISLRGTADVSGKFSFNGQKWSHQASANLRQVSLIQPMFPLPLTEGEGKLFVQGDRLRCELRMLANSVPVTLVGEAPAGGRIAASWVEIRTEQPLTLDERVIAALEAHAQKTVRAFHPRGAISFAGRFERERHDQPTQRRWRIEMHDLEVQHEMFPYPIDHVRGFLDYDSGQWTFRNLTGRNDSGHVSGEGTLGRIGNEPARLDMQFTATDVPLDDDLRKSLSANGQKLWKFLQPRGNLDHLTISLGYQASVPNSLTIALRGQKWQPKQNVEGRSISLEPNGVTYRLDNVTGDFQYRDGAIEFANVRATHGRTSFSTQGECRPNERGGWTSKFTRVAIDRLPIDRDLKEALPREWSGLANRLQIDGPLSVIGAISVDHSDNPMQPLAMDWDVTVDLENGRVDFGTPLEHVHGSVRLIGHGGANGFVSRGELAVDSVIVRGVQVSQIRGPLVIDNQRLLLGAWSEPNVRVRQPKSISAKVFNGNLVFDGSLDLNEEGKFQVQGALDDANLWNVTLELMPNKAGMAGKAYGTLSLQGTTKGMHTWRGTGAVRLRDADIYEVPVFLAVLRLLAVRRQDNLVFRDANMDFRVVGDDLQFDRLDFHSELVSLKGRGHMTMTEQKPVDLQFYTQVGRDEVQLPLLRPLLGEASRSFLLIEVSGAAEKPNVTKKAFPAINEQLRQLFPELAEGNEGDAVSRPGLLKKRR